MPYYPKQSVKKRIAAQDEFVIARTEAPYTGPMIETSTGEFFVGSDSTNPGSRLIPKPNLNKEKFGRSFDVRQYNRFNFDNKIRNRGHKNIVNSKILPTDEDYKRGYYRRYYITKNNNPENVLEISKESFDKFLKERNNYDQNLYTVGYIEWYLEGDVYTKNFNNLENEMKVVSGIKNAFPLLDEFYIEPEGNPSDWTRYNIRDRFYPDNEEIPSNLPPTYKYRPLAVFNPNENIVDVGPPQCGNCIFFNQLNKNCSKWGALVRNTYHCKSWKVIPNEAFDTFDDHISNVMKLREEAERRAFDKLVDNPKLKETLELERLERQKRKRMKEMTPEERRKRREKRRRRKQRRRRETEQQEMMNNTTFTSPTEENMSSGGGDIPSSGGGDMSSSGGGGGY
jgi:hypothetical protein